MTSTNELPQEVTAGQVVEAETSNREATEKENEDSIYEEKLPNRLIIKVNPRRRFARLNYFAIRARKILRSDETLTITGVDKAISMACTLVELLKRQKIAKVTKIATNMNLDPSFSGHGSGLAWGHPVPTIVFHIERGDHATCVADYQQRKVIELFEKYDPESTGKLSKETIEKLNLPEVFLTVEEHQEQAKKFLQGIHDVDLPHFIRYSSLLVHPLLKNSVFKDRLRTLGITTQDAEIPQE